MATPAAASPSATFVHRTIPKYKSEKWLQKYGWERGKGLGKDGQGRLDFVKVSKKDNTSGLGKPSYEVKDFAWWDNMYTAAAQSVNIGTSSATGAVEIVAQKKEEKGKSVYSGLFVTGGTMEDERKDASRRSKVETEDDLFAACGKRELRKFGSDAKKARLAEHDAAMKAHIDDHNKKRLDILFEDLTEAERKKLDKEERKKEKKDKEKKKKANKKSEERKKKRKRAEKESDSSDDETAPVTKKPKISEK